MSEAIEEQLDEREAAFVAAYVERRGLNAAQAAVDAGYSANGSKVQAHKLLKRDRVRRAIRREAERLLQAGVVLGASVLADLAANAKNENVRRAAAKDLLDHGGLPAITRSEHVVTVRDNRTDAQLREHIARLSRDLGLAAITIEGTATEAPAPTVALPRPVVDALDAEPAGDDLPDLFS